MQNQDEDGNNEALDYIPYILVGTKMDQLPLIINQFNDKYGSDDYMYNSNQVTPTNFAILDSKPDKN